MHHSSAPSRRSFLAVGFAVPLAAALPGSRTLSAVFPQEPTFTDPPGTLPASLRQRLDEARTALENGQRTTDGLLCELGSNELRPYAEFRELIRRHAKRSITTLVPTGESGQRLIVRLRLLDEASQPRANALVYAYQTSAKGWYSADAPHISGVAGDARHARLFGYCRTDPEGWVELATIRPGGYPRSTLPQHIHLGFEGEPGETGGGQVRFDDDLRLTAAEREHSASVQAEIVKVARVDGIERCEVRFTLRRDS